MSTALVLQGRRTSDGFLNSSEYSLWASTMKLEDNEARPILKESHFVSIAGEAPPEVFTLLCPCLCFN